MQILTHSPKRSVWSPLAICVAVFCNVGWDTNKTDAQDSQRNDAKHAVEPGPVQPGPAAYVSEISRGFLIVDGEYIPTPYTLAVDSEVVWVGDQVFDKGYFDFSSYKDQEVRRGGRFAESGRGRFAGRGPRPSRRGATNINDLLWQDISSVHMGATVLLNQGQPPQVILADSGGAAAYLTLSEQQSNPTASLEKPSQLKGRLDDAHWGQLVSVYQSSPKFQLATEDLVARVQAVDELSEAQMASNKWMDRFAFPLTVFGYIMVVFAVGHLMQHSSKMFNDDSTLSDEALKKVSIRTLAIVAVLSAVDLVWTLMAHHAGSMRELNPLGSGVIDDPVRLVLFKICVTSISIGLLYHLHQSTMARRAAWWCCLVLTLLTARWLTFQSMFV